MGKYFPSVKSLLKLRKIFNVPIDYILGLSDSKMEGIQTSDLEEDEIQVLKLYKNLDFLGKERTLAYIEGYLSADRVGGGFHRRPLTPPDMRFRIRRFS